MRMIVLAATLTAATLWPATANAEAWTEKANADVKQDPAVVEAFLSSRGSYWVSYRNPVGRFDMYAQTVCFSLKGSGMPEGRNIVITIWDAHAMARKEFKRVGRTICDN